MAATVTVTPIYQTSTTIGSRRFRKPHDFRSEPFSDVRPITIFDGRFNKEREQWEEGALDGWRMGWTLNWIQGGANESLFVSRRANLERKYFFLKKRDVENEGKFLFTQSRIIRPVLMRANQIRFRATAFLEFHCPKETSTYATTDRVPTSWLLLIPLITLPLRFPLP